jgi:hypothetical protein
VASANRDLARAKQAIYDLVDTEAVRILSAANDGAS